MFRRRNWFLYAIQIGLNDTVLQVGYCTDPDKTLRDFLRTHPQIRNSVLRPDLTAGWRPVKNWREAKTRCQELIRDLTARGYEVIAGPTLIEDHFSLYVIELGGDPRHVYVGQTNYPRELRLEQHIYKLHPARALLKTDILNLAEDLCAGLPAFRSQTAALASEKALAAKLKSQGYRVEGGT